MKSPGKEDDPNLINALQHALSMTSIRDQEIGDDLHSVCSMECFTCDCEINLMAL